MLDEFSFGAQLREWLKTLRKKNASVVFATQSLADIERSPIAPPIIESCLTRLFEQLLSQAQRLSYDVDQIGRAFHRLYPEAYSASTSSQQLVVDAKERWQTSQAAFQDLLRVQAGVVQSLATTRSETNALVSASQSAVGALQAAQAGNQLTALQIKQLADLTALIAAQARGENLAGARNTANQEQARAQISRFLTSGQGYQAQPVQLFR